MSLHETSSTEAGPRATDLTNKTLNRGRRDEGANLIFQNASPDGSEDYSSHAASGVPAGTAMLDVNQAEKMTRRAQPSAAQQAAVPTSSLPATSVAQDIPTGHHPTGAMLDYNLAEKKAHQSHHPSTSSSSLPAQSSSKLNDAKLNQLEQDEAEYRDRNASALKAHARHEAETFRQGVTHGSLNPKHETQKEIDALEKSEAAYRQSMQPHIQHNANLEAAAIEQKFKNDANTSSLPSMPAIPSMADVTESAKAIGANTVGALGAGMTTVANAVTPSPQTTQSIKNALPTTETAINLKNAVTPSQQTTENIKAAVVPSQETTDSIKNAVLPSKATTDSLSAAAEVPVHGITNLATRAKETVGDVSNYATAAATNAAVTASSLWDAVFQTNNDRFRVDALEGCEQQYRQTPGVVSHQKAHARREALIVKKAVNQKDGLEVPDLDAHVVTPSHVVSDLPKEDNSEWKEIDRQEDKAREERKQLAIDQMALAKDTSNIIKEKNKPAPGLLSGTANAAANAASAALAGVFGINMSSPNEQHKSRDIPHSDNVSKAHGAPSNERGHIEHKTPSPSTTAESLTARSPEKADEEPRQHHWHDHQRRGPVVDIHGPKDVSGPAPSRIVAHHGSGPSPSDLAMGQNESSAPISENRQHMPYAAGSVEPFMENQPTHPETDRDGGQGDWIHPDSHQHQHQLPRSAATQEQRPLGSERHHAPHAKIEPIPVAPQHHHDEQQSQHRPLQSQLHQMPEVNRTLPSEHHHVHSDRQHAPEPAIPRSHIPHSNVSSASGVTDVLPAGQISGSQPGNTAYSEVPGTTSVHMADPTHLPSNLVDQPIEHISATRVTRRPINDVAETMRAILPTDGAVPVKTSALQNIKVEGAPPAFENPTGGEKLMNFVVNGPEGFSEGGVRPFRPSDQKVAGDHHHHNPTSQPQATVPIASAAEVPGMTQHTRSDLSTNPASSHHGSTSAPTSRNVQQETQWPQGDDLNALILQSGSIVEGPYITRTHVHGIGTKYVRVEKVAIHQSGGVPLPIPVSSNIMVAPVATGPIAPHHTEGTSPTSSDSSQGKRRASISTKIKQAFGLGRSDERKPSETTTHTGPIHNISGPMNVSAHPATGATAAALAPAAEPVPAHRSEGVVAKDVSNPAELRTTRKIVTTTTTSPAIAPQDQAISSDAAGLPPRRGSISDMPGMRADHPMPHVDTSVHSPTAAERYLPVSTDAVADNGDKAASVRSLHSFKMA